MNLKELVERTIDRYYECFKEKIGLEKEYFIQLIDVKTENRNIDNDEIEDIENEITRELDYIMKK